METTASKLTFDDEMKSGHVMTCLGIRNSGWYLTDVRVKVTKLVTHIISEEETRRPKRN